MNQHRREISKGQVRAIVCQESSNGGKNPGIQTNLPARCGLEVSPGKVTSLTANYSPVTNLKGLVTSGSSSESDILKNLMKF